LVEPLLPPHNLEAEKSVLGAVLLDERHLEADQLEPAGRPATSASTPTAGTAS
jgi:hypothetical protein